MTQTSNVIFPAVAAVVILATVTDLHSRRIPNWLVVPFLVSGVAFAALTKGWSGVGSSLLGILSGACVLGLFCYLGGMGMGDLKLCAAVGAWVGPQQLLMALVVTGIAGGIMALCWAFAGGFAKELFSGTGELIFGLRQRGLRGHETLNLDHPQSRKMPYAPAIAIGTILSFFSN